MSHRLFHTLVLSSAVLLEACGGSSGTSEPTSSGTATNDDTSGSEQAANGTSNATQGPGTPTPIRCENGVEGDLDCDGQVSMEEMMRLADEESSLDAEMQAAVRDARACENGWPTTKGARFTSDATNTYACSSLGSETVVCCVSGPAPTTGP